NPAFQIRVLIKALKLLEAPGGPVLETFNEDEPATEAPAGPPACPVNFERLSENISTKDQLLSAFKQEVSRMRNWYDLAVQKRNRTTRGATGLEPEAVADFLVCFVQGDREANPVADVSLAAAIRMAAEDLKAYYLEAVTAQPGPPTDSVALADWFWGRTAAARVINAIREICLDISDKEFNLLGTLLLVPRKQLYQFQVT
ncbi:MAG: hypothetical protein GY850_18805, partial [bacterium]|nr:hypothetical protein [bacterium]